MEIKINKTNKPKIIPTEMNDIGFGNFFSDHMFTADFINGKWVDCQIIPFSNLTISPINLTLHYGQSIFEGLKADKNKLGEIVILNPEKNANRFKLSAERMCMEPVPNELFLNALYQLVSLDSKWVPTKKGCSLYVRPLLIAMDNSLGLKPSNSYKFIIVTGPVGPLHDNPIKLQTLPDFIRATAGGVGEAKTAGNYAASLLASKISKQNGFNEVLWLDNSREKNIQEVGNMNIFFVINDLIITPIANGAILKGIMREMVLKLLKSKGFKIEIRNISIYEIIKAYENNELNEIFGTGTAAMITIISEINHENKNLFVDTSNKNTISKMVKSEIEKIKKGEIMDSFNWVKKIK
jgi:branched-chain amino acid aminotransferase